MPQCVDTPQSKLESARRHMFQRPKRVVRKREHQEEQQAHWDDPPAEHLLIPRTGINEANAECVRRRIPP